MRYLLSGTAGPTGHGLYRERCKWCKRCKRCEIVAPSLIPRRAGDRIKNDRRDCARLAELARAGELQAIWVPDEEHESLRDLCRAREDAVSARLKARQPLKAFLLRHHRRYPGKTSWNTGPATWIAEQRFDHAGERLVLAEYQLAVQALLAAVSTRRPARQGLRRGGPGTRWSRLGDRSPGYARSELNERKRPAAMRGSFTMGRVLKLAIHGKAFGNPRH